MGAAVVMMRKGSKRGAVMVAVATLLCLLAVLTEGASSNTNVNVMVPAYFDASANPSQWAALNSAAASLPNRVVAIANVNSGPDTAVNPSYTSVIKALQAKSGRAIGYVATNYSAIPLATIKTLVDSWFSFYPTINGIFFDEGAYTDGQQAYYQNLYNYVKSKNSTSLVVTNPGTSTLESYLFYNGSRAADVICIYESNASAITWTTSSWTLKYDRSNFYAIFWNVSDINVSDFDYGDVIDHAYQQNVGWIYVTDDGIAANPYNRTPSYFSGEISYIKNKNYL